MNAAIGTKEEHERLIRDLAATGYEGLTNGQARFLLAELDAARRKVKALMIERGQFQAGLR